MSGAPFDADSTLTYLESPARRRANKAVAGAALTIYATYLVFRALYTFNTDAPLFSALIYAAEVYGFLGLCFYVFQTWELRGRTVPAPLDNVSVDVFITTINEDPSILRQTLRAAVAMTGPHTTYVLDDGGRAEVKSLAESLGCRYIARETTEGAKAGNWNHAFAQTSGQLIATFDADHAPRADFLARTLGFFRDPKVAFVQVPQRYHNVDSVQHRINWKGRRMYTEGEETLNVINPGRDNWDAAPFCGTGAVLRRAALEPHGGLQTGTVAEDVHTSLALHAAGWKSIYLDELLVSGLAPMDFTSFLGQRLRWTEGNLQVLRARNPLTTPGLTAAQRICYAASMYGWMAGFVKLVFYIAPAWMLVTGAFPVARLDAPFLAIYSVFLLSTATAYTVLGRGHGRLLMNEVFSMATAFTLNRAVRQFLLRRAPAEFTVTSKRGVERPDLNIAFPYVALIVASLLALEWSILSLRVGITADYVGSAAAGLWLVFNHTMRWPVIEMAVRPPQKRYMPRFPASCPVSITLPHPASRREIGMTGNVSPSGCELLWLKPLPNGSRWPMSIRFGGHVFECTGEVVASYSRKRGPWFVHGVHFINLTQAQTDFLNDVLFNMVVPQLFERFAHPALTVRLWREAVKRWEGSYAPRARRALLNVPVRLDAAGTSIVTMMHDISASGLGVMAPRVMPEGTPVTVTVLGAHPWSVDATVARCQALPASLPTFRSWRLGLQLNADANASSVHRRMSEEAAA